MKFETVPCNLCGEDNVEKLLEKGMYDLPANLAICKNCGLGYLNPRWTKESYEDFYANQFDSYFRNWTNDFEAKKLDFNSIFYIARRMQKNTLWPKEVHKVLDIGTGMGETLFFIKQFVFPNAKYFAIEPSVECTSYLKKQDVEVIDNDADNNWEERNTQFDVVILKHVLEHFLDPRENLAKIRKSLSTNGILIIAVPDALHPAKPVKNYFNRVVHTYYFSKPTLECLLKQEGYEILSTEEGTDANPNELFIVAKPTEEKTSINVANPELANKQIKILKDIIEIENSIKPTFREWLMSNLRKILNTSGKR